MDCVTKTIKWEGLGGFYKGVASPLIGQMVFNAVQFCVYGQSKEIVRRKNQKYLTIPQYFEAGLLTGICVSYIYIYYDSLVESPMDFFKSQIQIQIFEQQAKPTEYKPEFNGVIDCAKKVVSKYGIRGFYQGLGPTLLRDAIAVSFYFGVYEMIRRSFLKPGQSYGDVEKLSLMKLFWAGGFAGVVYWLSVYPIDVVKSQMMADSVHPEKRIYKNMIDCAKKIYAKEGPKVFFKGFLPCIIRSFPANAACFICYQKSLQLLM